jgi:hypothetical protein
MTQATRIEEAQGADVLRQVVNVVAFVVTLVVNGLANALPLNGQTTAMISDSFPVRFVPAGYVFAIWGVIYLALTAFVVYQALPGQRANPLLRRVGWLFALSCALNSAWIFLWHWELFPLTLLVMAGLLVTLIAIYLRLDIGRAAVTLRDRLLVHLPFSIYLGWITVATIANATDLLYWLGWNGAPLAPEVWAALLLLVATGITLAVLWTRRDVAYAAVIVWAFVGILVKQADAPLVAYTAGLTAALIAVVGLALLFLPRSARLVPTTR